MEKLFEQILKYIPSDLIPLALACAAIFLGIYYYHGYRSPTDVLHNSLFLSSLIVVFSAFLLYKINIQEIPASAIGAPPLLLVSEFEDDERGQVKALFVQQLDAAIQEAQPRDNAIVGLNSFLTDQEAAKLTAKRFKAVAVVYSPRVVRTDGKQLICFKLLRVDPEASKTYPPISIELDKHFINDLTETLASANSLAMTKLGASATRFEALEKRVSELEADLARMSMPSIGAVPPVVYKHKYALVIGIDRHEASDLPKLMYAISDSERIARSLQQLGFNVTKLTDATHAQIDEAIGHVSAVASSDDFFVFYYSGTSVRTDKIKMPGDPQLIIGTFDLNLQRPRENLTLQNLVERIKSVKARHKLVLLDTCYGTFGVQPQLWRASDPRKGSDPIFQIFAGSQDDQVAAENNELKGGVFTNALIESFNDSINDDATPMEDLARRVERQVALVTGGQQRPKLTSVGGTGQIVWKGSRVTDIR